jgi:large-conductance mechanosensitive channel
MFNSSLTKNFGFVGYSFLIVIVSVLGGIFAHSIDMRNPSVSLISQSTNAEKVLFVSENSNADIAYTNYTGITLAVIGFIIGSVALYFVVKHLRKTTERKL